MHASRRIILVIKIEQSFRHSDWWSGEYFDGHDPRHGGFEKSGQRVAARFVCGGTRRREDPDSRAASRA
jgi:hypothetical protein